MSTPTTAAAATAATAPIRKALPTIPPYGPHAIQVENLTFTYQSDNNRSSSIGPNGASTKYVLKDLNLHLAKGSRCLLIGANGSGTCNSMCVLLYIRCLESLLILYLSRACVSLVANRPGKSTLMRILAGRHLPKPVGGPSSSSPPPVVKVLGLNAFHDTRLNFHRAYLDCDWGMRSIAFVGAAVPLMADIAVRNMMERLQAEYPDRRDELLDMLGIDLDWVRLGDLYFCVVDKSQQQLTFLKLVCLVSR
jgi:CCR4-NOT complex subunit CAF16